MKAVNLKPSNMKQARLLALLVPLALLLGAYGFQYVGGLYPCEMCWWQRYAHFAALALGVLAFLAPRRAIIALSALAIAVAAIVGGFHAGVEYGWWKGLTECTTMVNFGASGADPLAAIMNAPLIRCDVVQWKMFGISMAGYNFLISGAAALAIAALLAKGERA